ncbi:MAG: hypothetical protein JXB88_15525 [Spirochaetales bacterium]|nr:hypothetical protein [Spirochaetales bacterium]
MLISESRYNMVQLTNQFNKALENDNSLEEKARVFVETFYNMFSESIVLLRLFITVPFAELPGRIQNKVSDLAQSASLKIDSDSQILTLFGTKGEVPDWNDRTKSNGHQGIPLATADFVSSIPMMSALLEQLGFNLGWIRGEPDIVAEHIGKMAGTFYVPEANVTKDSKGRLIIAFQDFVKQYNIRSVFGIGGGYTIGGKFMVVICFLREYITRDIAIQFQGLANSFKAHTQQLIIDKSHYGLD